MGEGNYFDHKNGTGSPKPDLKNGTGPPKSVLAKLDRCVITMQSLTHTHITKSNFSSIWEDANMNILPQQEMGQPPPLNIQRTYKSITARCA